MKDKARPKLGKMFICLNVKDIHISYDFYEKLGFKQSDGDLNQSWIIMSDGINEIHLFQGHINSNCINFRGGDVCAIAESLKNQDLKMTSDAEKESDGSVGAWIKDPDGNDIYFNTEPVEQ